MSRCRKGRKVLIMIFSMSVTVFHLGEFYRLYDFVTNVEHNGSFVRIFLSSGEVKCFCADGEFSFKVFFTEIEYPF